MSEMVTKGIKGTYNPYVWSQAQIFSFDIDLSDEDGEKICIHREGFLSAEDRDSRAVAIAEILEIILVNPPEVPQ